MAVAHSYCYELLAILNSQEEILSPPSESVEYRDGTGQTMGEWHFSSLSCVQASDSILVPPFCA